MCVGMPIGIAMAIYYMITCFALLGLVGAVLFPNFILVSSENRKFARIFLIVVYLTIIIGCNLIQAGASFGIPDPRCTSVTILGQ